MKKIKIVWPDQKSVDLILFDGALSDWYYKCITHLKNVPLHFGPRENPLDLSNSNHDLRRSLIEHFSYFGISVNFEKLSSQNYLNQLHDHYLKNFDKNQQRVNQKKWLEIHDLIHLLEYNNDGSGFIWMDYKESAGPLIKKFDRKLLQYSTSVIKKGHCYLSAHELGKDLYKYWNDKEPNDIKNICRISKPWLFLRPLIDVAIKDCEHIKYQNISFLNWLQEYRNDWCRHWLLDDWQPQELCAFIPVGYIPEVDLLLERFSDLYYPVKITND
jgi:hypothetical protein